MVNELYCVYIHLINHLTESKKDKTISKLIKCIDGMLLKLNTYWEFSIEIVQICMILDPRQKIDKLQSKKENKKAVENLEKMNIYSHKLLLFKILFFFSKFIPNFFLT